jgi:putative transcriptional regulator
MAKRDIGTEILEGIREIQAYKRGETSLRTHELSTPSSPQEIRMKLNLSQQGFATLMGVSVRTIQEWEQGRREPTGPAKALLRIAEQHPQAFLGLE